MTPHRVGRRSHHEVYPDLGDTGSERRLVEVDLLADHATRAARQRVCRVIFVVPRAVVWYLPGVVGMEAV
jgi:hypothetical protein